MRRMNKRGSAQALVLAGIFILVAAVIGFGSYMVYNDRHNTLDANGAPAGSQDLGSGESSCSGINNVAITYDDQDKYTPGTDPGVGNLFITTDKTGSLGEGSNTLYTLKDYQALAGQNATAYFAEKADFKTGCSDARLPVEVRKASAPTITFTNDNGKTVNSDTDDQSMDASSTYDMTMTVKSPSKVCSSRHGAVIIASYDKSFVNKVEFANLAKIDTPDIAYYVDGDNNVADGMSAFVFPSELCNGAKIDLPFSVTTTSTTPDEGNATMAFEWMPENLDVDATTFAIIGPAVEDEDNNAITLGNTTSLLYAD